MRFLAFFVSFTYFYSRFLDFFPFRRFSKWPRRHGSCRVRPSHGVPAPKSVTLHGDVGGCPCLPRETFGSTRLARWPSPGDRVSTRVPSRAGMLPRLAQESLVWRFIPGDDLRRTPGRRGRGPAGGEPGRQGRRQRAFGARYPLFQRSGEW